MLAVVLRALLLLGTVCAAAIAPDPTPSAPNSTTSLEELVSDMAQGQQQAVAASEEQPRPLQLSDEDVVILDAEAANEGRRQLGACNCNGGYRNGVVASGLMCSKRENDRNVCYPAKGDGECGEHTMTRCGRVPQASPAPIG